LKHSEVKHENMFLLLSSKQEQGVYKSLIYVCNDHGWS